MGDGKISELESLHGGSERSSKLGTDLFLVVLSRLASAAADQPLADDPSDFRLTRPLELTYLALIGNP